MSKELNLNNIQVFKTGTLPKSGEEYVLVLQTPANIDQIAAFHAEVFNTLTEDEKHFLIQRDEGYFERHFENGNVVLDVLHNGKIIAQSLMTVPTQENPATGMIDVKLPAAIDKIAILNGSVVHPDYRGQRLQAILTEARLELAQQLGRTHILSEVAVGNQFSWSTLLKEGMKIHSIGQDTHDNAHVYNMHLDMEAQKGKLKAGFNASARKKFIPCSQFNIEAQQILLSLGYHGEALDTSKQSILFTKASRNKKTEPKAKNDNDSKVPGLYKGFGR